MDVRGALLALLGLQGCITQGSAVGNTQNSKSQPGTTISSVEEHAITSVINQARSRTRPAASDMLRVSWDHALAKELNYFVASTDPQWFFSKYPLPGPAGRGNSSYAGFHLMREIPFKDKFPGYGFVIHDTCRAYENNVLKIIQFRIRQAYCINYKKCSKSSFNNFESCGSPLVSAPSQPCSWATQYLPRMSIASLDRFACVLFNVHGPNAPKSQDWSFWCYGRFIQPVNDLPFSIGRRCTKCPDEAAHCVKNLCA